MPTEDPKPGDVSKNNKKKIKNLVQAEEFFGPQYNKTSELPNPESSLRALATGVVEVIAGSRQIDQLGRLLTDEVYQRLARRAILARLFCFAPELGQRQALRHGRDGPFEVVGHFGESG